MGPSDNLLLTCSSPLPASTSSNTSHPLPTGLSQMVVRKQLSNLPNTSCSLLALLALLSVRNTAPAGHAFSPAQRLFGHQPRTNLPQPASILTPINVTTRHRNKESHGAENAVETCI